MYVTTRWNFTGHLKCVLYKDRAEWREEEKNKYKEEESAWKSEATMKQIYHEQPENTSQQTK